jgi:threonyl-tRNA synthetase
VRETGQQKAMELESLVKEIKSKTKNYPFSELALPRLLSKRPIF